MKYILAIVGFALAIWSIDPPSKWFYVALFLLFVAGLLDVLGDKHGTQTRNTP